MTDQLSIVSIVNASGGSGLSGVAVSQALADRGHRVTVLTYPDGLAEHVRAQPNLDCRIVDPMFIGSLPHPAVVLSFASAVRRVADERAIDLIHAHYAAVHGEAAHLGADTIERDALDGLLPKGTRRPAVVVSCRGTDVSRFSDDPRTGPGMRYVLSRAAAVTYVSRDLQRRAIANLGLAHAGFVVPNFIVPTAGQPSGSQWRAAPSVEPPVDGSAPVFVHVSNFRPIKNVDWIVKAFQSAASGGDEMHLLLVGDGPTRPEIERLVRDLRLGSLVTFTGLLPPDQVGSVVRHADVLVMASDVEGCPRAVLEAMAEAKAVIATDVGGLNELIVHRETGLLAPAGDLSRYADAIATLARHPELRESFGAAGRARVERDYNVDVVMDRYHEVFDHALDRSAAGR